MELSVHKMTSWPLNCPWSPSALVPSATVKEKEIGPINTPQKNKSSLSCIQEHSEERVNQVHLASVSIIFTKDEPHGPGRVAAGCVKTVVVSLARCETCQIHFPRVKGEGMRSLQGGRISRGHPSQLSASRQPRPRLSLPPLSPSTPGASSRAVTSSEPQQPLLSNGFWGKHSSLAPEPPCPSLRLLKVILSPWL